MQNESPKREMTEWFSKGGSGKRIELLQIEASLFDTISIWRGAMF